MIEVACPHCGPRNVAEFRYLGERLARPDPNAADPETWRAYLYLRDNRAGWMDETWLHRSGCRRWLAVERHTVTNEIRAVRDVSSAADPLPPNGSAEGWRPGRDPTGGPRPPDAERSP